MNEERAVDYDSLLAENAELRNQVDELKSDLHLAHAAKRIGAICCQTLLIAAHIEAGKLDEIIANWEHQAWVIIGEARNETAR